MKKIIFLIFIVLVTINGCKKAPLGSAEEKITPENFLSGKMYDKIAIEVVNEKGYELNSQTISNLQNFLSSRLNKPNGIVINVRELPNQGRSTVSLNDVANIEKQFRLSFSKGSTLAVFVYAGAVDYSASAGNAKVLGIAYGNTSIALFGKTISSYSGGLTQPPRAILESTVIEHEFGHLMGLVDNGTNMVEYHLDAANGKHCNHKDCLMYYTAETSDIVANLLGGEVPALENFCVRDLQFNGGK
ncbi:MAG TPA: peptidase [Bacteroidia bacterium]|jgi:hypothetical protein|nr:peptidase [Bacteroidia bacterium]